LSFGFGRDECAHPRAHLLSLCLTDIVDVASDCLVLNGQSVARDNQLGNCTRGISVLTSSINIDGNFIGIDRSGTTVLPIEQEGIFTSSSAGVSFIGNNIIAGCKELGLQHHGHSTTIFGNRIGTDFTGTVSRSNLVGVHIGVESHSNIFGGPLPQHANVVSGNSFSGIVVDGFDNVFQNNFVGTDITGSHAIPNGFHGVENLGGNNTFIRNVISGNSGHGLYVAYPANNTAVKGCMIGVSAFGNVTIGNTLVGLLAFHAGLVLVGGLGGGDANIIAGNIEGGIKITASPNIRLLSNSIYGNNGFGIQRDTASGGERPLTVNVVSLEGSRVTVSVQASEVGEHIIQVFTSSACDDEGAGDVQELVGQIKMTLQDAIPREISIALWRTILNTETLTAMVTSADTTSPFSR